MSEDRKTIPPEGPDPIDLAEARAARALARALEGEDPGEDPQVLEALEAAAQVKSAAEPDLAPEAIDRIAGELFDEPKRHRGWRALSAIAAVAACLVVGLSIGTLQMSRAPAPSTAAPRATEVGEIRAQARTLLASLMPPGGSPAGRADHLARQAAARIRGNSAGGQP